MRLQNSVKFLFDRLKIFIIELDRVSTDPASPAFYLKILLFLQKPLIIYS